LFQEYLRTVQGNATIGKPDGVVGAQYPRSHRNLMSAFGAVGVICSPVYVLTILVANALLK
jgi:hypothetical protein